MKVAAVWLQSGHLVCVLAAVCAEVQQPFLVFLCISTMLHWLLPVFRPPLDLEILPPWIMNDVHIRRFFYPYFLSSSKDKGNVVVKSSLSH